MKIIDLLNKIANGEEVPKKIKYKEKIFIYCSNTRKYYNENIDLFLEFYSGELLNDEVEIIEEQQDIDIQKLDENIKYCNIIEHSENEKILFNMIQNTANRINKLVQAVKQLDKKIKEKEQWN